MPGGSHSKLKSSPYPHLTTTIGYDKTSEGLGGRQGFIKTSLQYLTVICPEQHTAFLGKAVF